MESVDPRGPLEAPVPSGAGRREPSGEDAAWPHKAGLPRMPRVDAVLASPVYRRERARLDALERERPFCRHGLAHLIDTARIMWILSLERGCGLDREVVYATAMLHDIGKARQYEDGEPHELAGERLAGEILDGLAPDVAFAPDERAAMLGAIRGHRRLRAGAGALERLLYQADKASRPCFACPVRGECSWPEGKMNGELRI